MVWPYIVYISPCYKQDYVIVKSTQRSLAFYGYPKYFCSVFYTSVPHCILLPFHSMKYTPPLKSFVGVVRLKTIQQALENMSYCETLKAVLTLAIMAKFGSEFIV